MIETREPVVTEAIAIIDKALAEMLRRELVSATEVADLLLDLGGAGARVRRRHGIIAVVANRGPALRLGAAIVGGRSYTLTLTNRDDNKSGQATYTLFDSVAVT